MNRLGAETPTPEESPPIKVAAARGAKWSFVGATGRQMVRFVFLLFLARLVGPADFGIAAQAATFIILVSVLLDQGLGATIIQRRALTGDIVGSAYWINTVATLLLTVGTFAAAPLVAKFFRTNELTAVVQVLSLSVLFQGLAVIPRAMISRHLGFKRTAVADLVGPLAGGLAGVAAAAAGAGYWALIVQTVCSDALVAGILFAYAGRPAGRATRAGLGEVFGFSGRVFGVSVMTYLGRNLDNVLVGRVFGATQLAFYSLSYRTLMVPVMSLGMVANRVALPVFSRLQDDTDQLRRSYLAVTRVIALIAIPLMAFTVVEAPYAVPVLFGDEWTAAVVPMQILAVTGMRQSVQSTTSPLLIALGKTKLLVRFGGGSVLVYSASFFVGVQWSIAAVAACYAVVDFLIAPVVVRISGRLLAFSAWDYLTVLLPAAAASAILAATAEAAVLLLEGAGMPIGVTLAASSFVGVLSFLAAVRYLWPDELSNLKSRLRASRD
jgi:PST family polysaccharide transporter